MRVTAIDFETAYYKSTSAIALGVTVMRDNAVVETRSWLFRPPGRIYIRPDFTDIHGIRPEDLVDKPNFRGVWPEMEDYFRDSDTLVAHNARFDRAVLNSVAAHYGILLPSFGWLCTVNLSRQFWPDLPNHKLPTVCGHLGIPLKHHDPASDAEACARIYLSACAA